MQEVYKSKTYLAQHYRDDNEIGIRRRLPEKGRSCHHGKQFITFGAGLGLSKLALERWAGRVLNRLDLWITM